MNSKSTTRLRLEYLETRTLLSVTGWLMMPHTAGPMASPAGEYSQSEIQSRAHGVMQAAAPGVTQIPGLISDSGTNLASSQVSPDVDRSSFEPAIFGGRAGDSVLNLPGKSDSGPHLTPIEISSTGPTRQVADLAPIVPEQDCADTSSIPIATRSPAVLKTGESLDLPSVDGGLITLEPDVPRHERQSLGEMGDVILTIDLVVLAPPEVQMDPNGMPGPGAAPAVNMGPMSGDVPPTDGGIELASASRATIGSAVTLVTLSRTTVPSISVTQETDAQPAPVDYSVLPVVQQHSTDSLVTSDTLRLADLAITSDTGTSASGDTISLANLAGFSSPASRFTESGFITIGDSQSNTSPQGNLAIDPVSGVQSTGLNPNWSIDPLANLRKSTDSAGAPRATSASGIYAVDVSSRSVSEGRLPGEGGIELAIADLSPAVSDSSGAGIPFAGGSIQQISNIPLESDVGLFCDMEVAVAGGGPAADSASTEVHRRDLDPVDAGANVMGWKSRAVKDFEPPLTNWSQPTLAGLIGRLPLILGVTILVSRGGLRLEEKVPERERKIRDFPQS